MKPSAPEAALEPAGGERIARPQPPLKILSGGVLMGLANLVPGVSGGTMILAMGLYDRFIEVLADVTRLRITRASLLFLGLLAVGALTALVGLSGLAVGLVTDARWIMYSLFIGMTLGGAPELARVVRPLTPGAVCAFLVTFASMGALAYGLAGASLPESTTLLVFMGVLGAASMILPGISGSYMLLIFGMYDVVIGALSAGALREDPGASLRVLVPVGVGAVLGMGLLSNLLKLLLARFRRASHAALLGLLVGSVLGLWPFRVPAEPELADKDLRQGIALLLAGAEWDEVNARRGLALDAERAAELRTTYAGEDAGDLKRRGDALVFFDPSAWQIGGSLGLFALGFLFTRRLGGGRARGEAS